MSSKERFEESLRLLPGGVSSPVRSYAPYPRFLRSGSGPRVTDVEGKEYVDYVLGFGPLLLGHAHPAVTAAVAERAARGTLFGAPVEEEIELARRVRALYPSIEKMRFVSTGSEATAHAIRLARGATGRKLVVKIDGGFHGAHDAVLAKAGSGLATFGIPGSAGVPEEVARLTLTLPFNDLPAMEETFRRHGGDVAAVLLEPVLANVGPILPQPGYLEGVRRITREHGALLVFDEIVTGFRLALGGAQEAYGVRPDLTTLGKALGGGLPLALFGGRADLLDRVAPSGPVYQAGTFSGNPLSLAAGAAALDTLSREGVSRANRAAQEIRAGLADLVEDERLPYAVAGTASLFALFFGPGPVRSYADAKRSDAKRYLAWFRELLEAGVYLPASQFETCFSSNAHGPEEVRTTIEAMDAALRSVAP
ncbi:MAG TPA: glutamate-1-semialdehyde 2,1-aminomutase [Candidatus Thermoplasmatota archaeon]|nr:glutamate-1-semialdehyde 2,1-aminomutase [Candidatus Thermoplasmatota archaeon]